MFNAPYHCAVYYEVGKYQLLFYFIFYQASHTTEQQKDNFLFHSNRSEQNRGLSDRNITFLLEFICTVKIKNAI